MEEKMENSKYDPNYTGYCSPKGLPKIISKLVPDVIFGVNMGYSCYRHTLGWEQAKETRDYKVHDIELKKNIQEDFMGAPVLSISVNGWKVKLPEFSRIPLAKFISNVFYVGATIYRSYVGTKNIFQKIKDWNKKP